MLINCKKEKSTMNELDRIRDNILDQLGNASILEPELPHPPRHGIWLESLGETSTQHHNQTNFSAGDLQRVLVICLDSIGDMVMLGPALRALRNALPQAKIKLLTSPAGNHIAPLLPWIDETLVYKALWQESTGKLPFEPGREIALIDQLRAQQFQLAIIFTSFSQSPFPAAYACYLAGIPHRLGFSREFGGNILSLSPTPPPDNVHQVYRNLYLLEQINIPVSQDSQLELNVPSSIQIKADELLASVGIKPDMPFIALAPGASYASRRYNPIRFAAVTHMLAMQTTLPLVILGSAQDAENIKPVIEQAQESPSLSIHSLVGRTTVPEFAAIIRRASLIIGCNSAVMHIADAFHCPMVILYSGTDLVSPWKPRHTPARLLCRPVFCSPCLNFDCQYEMDCLDIRPQEVVVAALEMLTGKFHSRVALTEMEVIH